MTAPSKDTLLQALLHGDDEHRNWLAEAVDAVYEGKEPPPPRGKGLKDARITQLEQQVKNLQNTDQVLTCVYCGHAYPPGTPTSNHDLLTEHIAKCPAHPMHGVTSALREAVHVMDKGMKVRMGKQFPALEQPLEQALKVGRAALADSVDRPALKLQQFKDYTHNRLDAMGVPKFEEEDCRIGKRLDWLGEKLSDYEDDLEAVETFHLQCDLLAMRLRNKITPNVADNAEFPEELRKSHLTYMCAQVIEAGNDWSVPKKMRWLGWVQAGLVNLKIVTLDEAKELSVQTWEDASKRIALLNGPNASDVRSLRFAHGWNRTTRCWSGAAAVAPWCSHHPWRSTSRSSTIPCGRRGSRLAASTSDSSRSSGPTTKEETTRYSPNTSSCRAPSV